MSVTILLWMPEFLGGKYPRLNPNPRIQPNIISFAAEIKLIPQQVRTFSSLGIDKYGKIRVALSGRWSWRAREPNR
jgi:hypothetical protein